jgi:polyisoprenoid-binding protein YceI
MKNFKTLAIALLVTFSALNASAQTKKVDPAKSKINWLAKKVTGQHEGTVNFKSGSLTFKGPKLTGGEFTVDMNSLTSTDLTGEYLGKLNGHLKSDDFFSTAKFPEATLVFTSVTPKAKAVYTVVANLTIKGITKPVTFDITTNVKSASTTFKVDRTKYDIKYGSGSFFDNLGDKAIDNEFELKVDLQF